MKSDVLPSVFILLLSLNTWLINGKSPPGKPMIINCQSSGNETFTCWWKPGSDGGLPTSYTLLYKTAREEHPYECPDYISAGPNSCYFDKKPLSLSTSYNITVKATNDLGSNVSDPHYIDAASVGKPDSPTDLSLEVKQLNGITCVWAKWLPPPLVTGAMSLQKRNYELRLKSAGEKEWEIHFVGEQTQYKIFQLHPGAKYTVQVRCITSYGEKSEWSPEAYIQLPNGQPPGKPEIIRCRSPEKETFTCWWKPSSDGGLPTNYTLFYKKEREKSYNECPDYKSGGPNSCYFDQKHTSIWTIYNVTVKATNDLGSNTSAPYYVDVAYIVEPDPPVNLTLEWVDQAYAKYLLLNWASPPLADVRSGWLTLEYELRIKPEEGQEWEIIFVGLGTKYQLFSLNSGVKYVVQVRCRTDNGEWSQWSSESYIQLPKEFRLKDIIVWIFVAFLSFIICLIMIWTMALKGFSMVACILPPVPGPKIPGFDIHLLKAGRMDEVISTLGCPVFPLTSASGDELEKWLVIDNEDQQLMPDHEKSHPNKNAKLVHQETDNDSGRGSCESPSLLLEKCKEAGNPLVELTTSNTNEQKGGVAKKCIGEALSMDLEGQFPILSSGGPKSSTWPGSQLANSQFPKCSYHDIADACKIASVRSPIWMGNIVQCHSKCPKTISEGKNTKLQEAEKLPLNVLCDQRPLWPLPTESLPFLPTKAMDYVEVHKVNHDGALAVLPKQKKNPDKTEMCPVPKEPKEYTRVSTVVANHILVLMPDSKVEALPSFQEPPKEPNRSCQSHLAEENMSYCLPAPHACKMQTGGLDYMDPNNFMCSFN
ncbi:prolactin receptor [Eublepharis macularius]|uniref:Prolactin receptor n=2 Tax=Eublepharis macularius TaxID=481883 RepID=A0AA97L5B4_EUBMA|nr:prolactin receptor [Eublepharis macularius]XP_054842688.1 prolactin receptor [Eublepharis macularius]